MFKTKKIRIDTCLLIKFIIGGAWWWWIKMRTPQKNLNWKIQRIPLSIILFFRAFHRKNHMVLIKSTEQVPFLLSFFLLQESFKTKLFN